jgi:hypothetical protein
LDKERRLKRGAKPEHAEMMDNLAGLPTWSGLSFQRYILDRINFHQDELNIWLFLISDYSL